MKGRLPSGRFSSVNLDKKGNIRLERDYSFMEEPTNQLLVRNGFPKAPVPPSLTDVSLVSPVASHNSMAVRWMDKEGHIYGTSWENDNKVIVSRDYMETTEVIDTNIEIATYGEIRDRALIVSNTGRIVVGTNEGHVFVSDENQTNFLLAFQFLSGHANANWGHTMYDNIILIAAYGDKVPDDEPREVYMSVDSGATWEKILDVKEDFGIIANDNMHMHGVGYDPYWNRILVTTGDSPEDRNLYYSDDYGDSWVQVYDPYTPIEEKLGAMQLQIIPYSHGIVFGYHYWKRPVNSIRTGFDPDDFVSLGMGGDLIGYPNRHWQVNDENLQMTLVPTDWFHSSDRHPAIYASEDGVRWYEVWRTPPGDRGFRSIVGPHPGDEQRRIFGEYLMSHGPTRLFSAKLPIWK